MKKGSKRCCICKKFTPEPTDKIIHYHKIMTKTIEKELIEFVKSIKKKTDDTWDKHSCDHLLWMIDENKELKKRLIKANSSITPSQSKSA